MSKTYEATGLHGPLDGLRANDPQVGNLEEAVRESHTHGDVAPLRAWAYERGAVAARSGTSKQALVDEMLELVTSLDGRLPSQGGEASPTSMMVVAAVEGYSEAPGGQAQGRAPIEHLKDRVAELTALPEDKAVSLLAVPVVLFTNEQLVGVISLRTFKERDFSETEIKFLETVAGEIAIAIENARLYEQTDARLRQKVAELTTLQGVGAHMASTLNLS